MGERKKVKYAYEHPKKWLGEVLETLQINREELEEYTPNLSKHQTIDDAYRLVCNNAAHEILVAAHLMRTRTLRDLYQKICRSRWRERNRTYMHQMIVYKVCEGLGLMTDRMRQNYVSLIQHGAEKVPDVFGGTMSLDKKGGSKKKKKPRGETVIGTIEECIRRAKGASKEEILKTLRKRFPDRKATSMRNTVGVQLSSQMKKRFGERLQKDGDRYKLAN